MCLLFALSIFSYKLSYFVFASYVTLKLCVYVRVRLHMRLSVHVGRCKCVSVSVFEIYSIKYVNVIGRILFVYNSIFVIFRF